MISLFTTRDIKMNNTIDFKQFPVIDVGQRNGPTDYIDYLSWNEIKYPVMVGADKFKRHFMVVKMTVDDKKVMQTFFQRYTNGVMWMPCGHATDLLLNVTPMKKDFNLIKDIIEGKKIKLDINKHSYDDIHKKMAQSFHFLNIQSKY